LPSQYLHILIDNHELRGTGIRGQNNLAGREIRVDQQAGLAAHHFSAAIGDQAVAIGGGAAVLPDDGVVNRLPIGTPPNNCGLVLVGDTDSRDAAR